MKRKVQDWSVEKLQKERSRITFPEYQREKALWTNERKSLLIDSILLDIDIPKLYFNMTPDNGIEVVDGQQRLWSVWQFLDDEYPYKVGGNSVLFSKMSKAQTDRIKDYKFQVTEIQGADEEYLRELFVRLQLGLLLNTGEKLHASTGRMKDFVFKKLADHKFIKKLGIPERRYAKETLCAQIAINSFTREKLTSFARTRYDDLIHFFEQYAAPQGKDRTLFEAQSDKIVGILDLLWKCFGEAAKDLKNRSYILSLYLFVEEIVSKGGAPSAKEQKSIFDFTFRLWKRLKEEVKSGFDRKNRELYSFETFLSSAPGEEYQIRRRHEKLNEFYGYFKQTGKIKGDR